MEIPISCFPPLHFSIRGITPPGFAQFPCSIDDTMPSYYGNEKPRMLNENEGGKKGFQRKCSG